MNPDLRIEVLTPETLERHLPDLLRTEEVFPVDLRETPDSIRAAMGHDRAFGVMLYDGDDYIGNAIAFGLSGEPFRELRIGEFRPLDPGVAYLFNIAALPGHQGLGHGKRLLSEIRVRAGARGFTILGGHFRDNASLRNFLALGGRELGQVENWYDTGETYTYAELSLNPPAR